MPDRMPENNSDRMQEDLPVTKCMNVMVVITRSNVFFSLPLFIPLFWWTTLRTFALMGKVLRPLIYWSDSTCWLLQPSNCAHWIFWLRCDSAVWISGRTMVCIHGHGIGSIVTVKKNKRKCKAMCLYVKWVCNKAGPRRFKCLELVRPRSLCFSSPHSTANKSMYKVWRIYQRENCEQFHFGSLQMQTCAVEFHSHEFQLFALLCARSNWKLRSWKDMGLSISGVLFNCWHKGASQK